MSGEVLAIAGIIALGMFIAICLASIVRGARTEAPPPEGRVTSSPVIRPRGVRPPARPMDWRDRD